MNTWERLKIGAAITGTVLVFLVIHWITDLVFPETYVAAQGYKVAGVSEPAVDLASLQRSWPAGLRQQGGRANVRDFMKNIEKVSVPRSAEESPAVAAPAPQVDLGTALAAADVAKGRQTAQVCTSCHTFDQGGQDRTGPSLWGIVGRNVASRKTFTYSGAFAAQTGSWTYERLDRWLANPAKAVPGTKMAFAGLHNAQDRANVIAFLSTLGASPVPFPKPGAGSASVGEQGSASPAKSDSKTGEQPRGRQPPVSRG
jgi:cytochrome c